MAARKADVPPTAESRVQAMIAALGSLSSWQRVTAEQALIVARLLDTEQSGPAAAALSRELRMLLGALVPAVSAAGSGGDAVAEIQDQLARKRTERAERAGGA